MANFNTKIIIKRISSNIGQLFYLQDYTTINWLKLLVVINCKKTVLHKESLLAQPYCQLFLS